MADSKITFVPAKNFEAVVYVEASGRDRGAAGARVSGSRRRTTSLEEIAEFVADRAQEITSEIPGMPRDTGGLRRSRVVGSRIVPRSTYDFRRERSGQRPYQSSFTEPLEHVVAGRPTITVFNLSPAAAGVEEGTGAEGQPINPSGRRVFRLPITQRRYRQLNKKMTLEKRRERGLISGDPEYRAASKREDRAKLKNAETMKQVERGGLGSKKALRTVQARKKAKSASSNPNAGQIKRQMRGYSRRFVQIENGRIGRSQPFAIKRRRYVVNMNGKAYLGTPNASRYDGYGIFRRAMQDAATRYL